MGCCGGGHNHRPHNDINHQNHENEHSTGGSNMMLIFTLVAIGAVVIYFLVK
ncbi:hypothetical protein CACET_c26020 [Clostridium aceticum]|uniref:Uncharacterized protein n=1 Tax=Clostridium aceticum TaxID=84022 RepID=A0A0G3WDR1_9CLOT|nr:hypothetical protein [Clostridium aceticum]AKL96047.1 hypothetical protein CACET_c26020 [Clostridium aceticum]